jgi:hypothetical protein
MAVPSFQGYFYTSSISQNQVFVKIFLHRRNKKGGKTPPKTNLFFLEFFEGF